MTLHVAPLNASLDAVQRIAPLGVLFILIIIIYGRTSSGKKASIRTEPRFREAGIQFR